MTDTLLILPTIGANVEKAAAALRAVRSTTQDMDVYVMADDIDAPMPLHILSDALDGLGPLCFGEIMEERRGLVAAYRDGFAYFRDGGDWSHLILMEDNVLVTPGWFEALSRTLDAHPHFGWVACGQIENAKAPFTSLCSMLTREAALATDGGPDLAYAPCQFDDGDMFMRLLAKGFTPHAVAHKVSHPEARTSRVGTIEDDWALVEAHRVIFQQRWGIPDFRWDLVPVHRGCGLCG